MARKEALDIALIASGLTGEHLEELDHPSAAPSRASEDRHADFVGFALFVAAELQEDATREQARSRLRRPRAAAVSEQRAQQTNPPLRDHALSQPVGAVAFGDVCDLMRQDRRDL